MRVHRIIDRERANRFHINGYTFQPHICQSVLASNPIAISSSSLLLLCLLIFVTVCAFCFSFFPAEFRIQRGFLRCIFCISSFSLPDAFSLVSLDFALRNTVRTSRTSSSFKNSLFKLILTISLNSTFYHRTFIIFIFFRSQSRLACTFFAPFFFHLFVNNYKMNCQQHNAKAKKKSRTGKRTFKAFLGPDSEMHPH